MMSTYGPYSRRDSFDGIEMSDRGVMDDHWITSDAASDRPERTNSSRPKRPPHPLVILGVIMDVLVIALVVVLEYFMR